jgi:hypothetical protein
MLPSLDRSDSSRGSRSRRVTYDDSVQIAGTSLAQRPALCCRWRGEKASGLATMGNVVVSGRRRTPLARQPASASRPRGKFFALQSLENAQNAERISLLRKPVPIGRQNGLAPTGKARRAAGGKGDRAITRATALEGLIRPGRKLQKKAPKALKSLDAEMKSAPRCAPRTYSESSSSPGGRRLARWGCVSSRVCAYQRRPSGRSGGKMRRVCNRLAHPLPRR